MISEKQWETILSLPKSELHVHVEGTLEPELMHKLAQRNKLDIGYGSAQALCQAWQFSDLPGFLKLYYKGMSVLQHEADFFELAFHYFQRAAQDGVVYSEVFFDPQAHTSRGVAFETLMRGLIRAQERAEIELGLKSKYIMCFLRDLSEKQAFDTLDQAQEWKKYILGVGLDSDGYNNPPSKFKRVFERAKGLGYRITMHAELDQKDIHKQIDECLNLIEVERLDHGVNAADRPDLMCVLIDKNIALTVCPVSMKCCNQTYALDKIERLFQRGVKITINSDDPSYFRAHINENLKVLAKSNLFSFDDLVKIIRIAFESSWLDSDTKRHFLDLFDKQLAAFISTGT